MSVPLIPLEKLLTGCPTCSYQNGGNPGAEFFLYMMLAMPWIIMAVVGFYFWTRRPRDGGDGSGETPNGPLAGSPEMPSGASAAGASTSTTPR